jgi:hypothetical protein
MLEITESLGNIKPALDHMEVVEVVEEGEAVVVARKYLQELYVHLSNSREVTVSMKKNVPSSAAPSINSSALH